MYRKTVYTIAHTFSLCFERLMKYRIKLVKFTDSSNMHVQCAHPQKQEEAKCWHLSGRLPAALQKNIPYSSSLPLPTYVQASRLVQNGWIKLCFRCSERVKSFPSTIINFRSMQVGFNVVRHLLLLVLQSIQS